MSSTASAATTTAAARRRLMRDLKELMNNPLETVSASPVDDSNMFLWHANLRGVDSQVKEIFHFILEFPSTYPINPPAIYLCTPLPHPNVLPPKNGLHSLCMDMLEEGQWSDDLDKNMKYSGWSSAYSIQVVLIQLQSFLLDVEMLYARNKGTLSAALAAAKAFKCKTCSHTSATPFPPLPTAQQLAARRAVHITRFVPRVRPAHMQHVVTKLGGRNVRAIATTAPSSTPNAQSKKQRNYKSSDKSTPSAQTTTSTTNTNEWVVVEGRRKPHTEEKKTKPKKISNPKIKIEKPKVAQQKQTKQQKQPKPTKAQPVHAEPPNPLTDGKTWKTKDYVQIMLQEAEEREKRLKQRIEQERQEAMQDKKKDQKEKQGKKKPKKKKKTPAVASTDATTPENAQETNTATETNTTSAAANATSDTGNATTTNTTSSNNNAISTATNKKRKSKNSSSDPTTPTPAAELATPAQNETTQTQTQTQNKKKEKESITFKELERVSRPDPTKLGSLSLLPFDSLLSVLAFLPISQVGRLAEVSIDMRKVAEDGILWREMFSKHYPKSRLTPNNIAEWKYVFFREVDHILDDLACFHTKVTFEEDIIGVPIKFSINPVTEKVDYISSTLDLISSTAFNKLAIRKSAYKEAFTHFLPLYITEDHFQRALPDIKKLLIQLSPEYRGSGFVPQMALSVFGKLMNTMIVLVMEGGLSASVRALSGYIAFHRLLLAFVEMYPQLMYDVNQSIEGFIKSEDGRIKSVIPSLGDWLATLSISNKYGWKNVVKSVLAESGDRQVIWICKENPMLANLADISKSATPGVEHQRLKESFEYSEVSNRLILFHAYFLQFIARPQGMSLAQVADNYDRYYGRPNSKTLDSFQKAVKKIVGMRGWPDFFLLAGVPCPTPAGLTQVLRDNVRNSKRKRYHNDATNFRNIQASGTSVILNRGDSYKAPKDLAEVVMKLGWGYKEEWYLLDATCLEYTKEGTYAGLVDWANHDNENESLHHSGDIVDYDTQTVTQTINISLRRVSITTHSLVFLITAFRQDLSASTLPWIRMSDAATSAELCQYSLDKAGKHTAVVMCVLQRSGTGWSLKITGKLDEGRYGTAYLPVKNTIPTLL